MYLDQCRSEHCVGDVFYGKSYGANVLPGNVVIHSRSEEWVA